MFFFLCVFGRGGEQITASFTCVSSKDCLFLVPANSLKVTRGELHKASMFI